MYYAQHHVAADEIPVPNLAGSKPHIPTRLVQTGLAGAECVGT